MRGARADWPLRRPCRSSTAPDWFWRPFFAKHLPVEIDRAPPLLIKDYFGPAKKSVFARITRRQVSGERRLTWMGMPIGNSVISKGTSLQHPITAEEEHGRDTWPDKVDHDQGNTHRHVSRSDALLECRANFDIERVAATAEVVGRKNVFFVYIFV